MGQAAKLCNNLALGKLAPVAAQALSRLCRSPTRRTPRPAIECSMLLCPKQAPPRNASSRAICLRLPAAETPTTGPPPPSPHLSSPLCHALHTHAPHHTGVQMAGISEAMAVGAGLGLDPTKLSEVMGGSTARCWSLDSYNPVPVSPPPRARPAARLLPPLAAPCAWRRELRAGCMRGCPRAAGRCPTPAPTNPFHYGTGCHARRAGIQRLPRRFQRTGAHVCMASLGTDVCAARARARAAEFHQLLGLLPKCARTHGGCRHDSCPTR